MTAAVDARAQMADGGWGRVFTVQCSRSVLCSDMGLSVNEDLGPEGAVLYRVVVT